MNNPLRSVEPHVFYVTSALVALFVLYTLVWPALAKQSFEAVEAWVTATFGWFYMLAVTFFLVFVIWLGLSRHGTVKVGPPDSEPEFSRLAWFTMLFAAGMGIGLVFWGVAEPVSHYADPPLAEPGTKEAMQDSLRFSFFHWGLHAWAVYLVVALALGYFHFRHDLPLAPRSAFYPLIGDRIYGPVGHIIDIIAIIATLFGLATSLGLGALQINVGLDDLFALPVAAGIQIAIIAVITAVATVSVVLGVARGIRHLSHFNMALATVLLLFVLIAGPTLFLAETLLGGIGHYLQTLPQTSFLIGEASGVDPGWPSQWTLFYWGWWMSWAPFVGMFIARISRGRTIREFIVSVLIMPVLYVLLWFTVFGGSAMWLEREGDPGIWEAVQESEALALYALFDQISVPWVAVAVSAFATVLVLTFFVTSIDSGSLVASMLATRGKERPPWPQRIVWSTSIGLLAAVLLLAGGLEALQTAAIAMGLPMAILMLVMCWSLVRMLRADQDRPVPEGSPPTGPP